MKIKLSITQFILLIALFTVLTLTVLKQSNPGTELPNRDYGFYSYIGLQIVRGELPYKNVWESKPPAIFYLNAFALRIGRGLRWGIWFVEFSFLFSAIAASFSLLKKLWGITPSIFGIFVWLWGMNFTLQGGNYTEEYPLVFHFLALTLLLHLIQHPKQRLINLSLGLLFSISFLFRPNNAIVEAVTILVLGASFLWKRDWQAFFTTVFWVTLGIVIPLIITSAYFAYHGLFQEMLEASILYNLTYSTTDLSTSSPLKVGFEFLNLAAWIGLVGYLLLFVKIKDILKNNNLVFFIVLLIGTPIAVYFSDPAKRNYGHYFMNWLPFIGVLSAFAFHTFQEKFISIKKQQLEINLQNILSFPPSIAFYFLIAIILFISTGCIPIYFKAFDRLLTSSEREIRSPIAIYVNNHTQPGDYVLFWANHPGENFMSRRDTPVTALFYPNMVNTSEIAQRLNDDFLNDLQNNPPVLIVDMGRLTIPSLDPAKRQEQKSMGVYPTDPPDNLDKVLTFISENYHLENIIKDKPVYRLNGTIVP